jgi:hypothetical protein
MKPKITGLTSFYLGALGDANHSMNGLVTMLATLDPKFKGKNFTYEPQDVDLFLSLVNLQSALAINAHEGVISFTGYPFFIQCDDKTLEVPSYFPASTYYAEDDLESETPLQKTFEQWVLDQNHTLYEYSGGFFAGNFQRHGLDFAQQVIGAGGFGLMEHSEAVTELASESVE